jgi:hypothetical protein
MGQRVFGGFHPRGGSFKYDHFIKDYSLRLVHHFPERIFGESMFHPE